MKRILARGWGLPAGLWFIAAIPIAVALARPVQWALGAVPDMALRFADVPLAWLTHAVAGALFALIGPLQFWPAFRARHWRLHRLLGRVFVGAAVVLSVSGLSLLSHFPGAATAPLDAARILGALALAVSVSLAFTAIRARNIPRHRAWMIRAYAIGAGGNAILPAMAVYFLLTGTVPEGAASDRLFVAAWGIAILLGEICARLPYRKENPA